MAGAGGIGRDAGYDGANRDGDGVRIKNKRRWLSPMVVARSAARCTTSLEGGYYLGSTERG